MYVFSIILLVTWYSITNMPQINDSKTIKIVHFYMSICPSLHHITVTFAVYSAVRLLFEIYISATFSAVALVEHIYSVASQQTYLLAQRVIIRK